MYFEVSFSLSPLFMRCERIVYVAKRVKGRNPNVDKPIFQSKINQIVIEGNTTIQISNMFM